MKKLALTFVAMALATAAFAQGTISMNSVGLGYLRFVSAATGVGVSNATAALYWNTANSADGMTMAGPTAYTTGGANAAAYGYILGTTAGGNRTVGTAASGLNLYFQLRAWTGGYSSWEAAVASGNPLALRSTVLASEDRPAPIVLATAVTGSTPVPTIAWGGTSTAPLSVAMVPVPEPSTIALAGLGLLGLIFIRRRK